MADRELYLGLDVGTQGTKGLVVDGARGDILARAGAGYGLIEGLPPGAAEQHPGTWVQAVSEVARSLWREVEPAPGELRGLGVSGQQHGLVVLDEHGEVVRPAKLWCDTATAEEAAELSRALGRSVPAGFTAPKALWMQRREPQRWAQVTQVMLPHDYVNLRLTGRRVTEFGDASGTGWFDPADRRWDLRALDLLGGEAFAERLPALLAPGDPAGELTPAGARLLDLDAGHAGALVSAGGGDNMMSAIGAGATRPGVAVLSLGTSATVFGYSERPVVDPSGAIAAFCDSTGGWLPLLCVMNATGVLEEVSAAFGADLEALTRLAESVPIGCDGVRMIPFLAGERVPDLPHATGALAGLRPGLLRAGHVFRAALEGVAFNLAWGVERMRNLGLSIDRLRAVGGGARNALWRSILADCLDATVEPCEESESAALGAALQALWTRRRADGEQAEIDEVARRCVRTSNRPVEADPERSGLYSDLARRFRQEVEARPGRGV